VCAGLALCLYLTGLGRAALWEPDEGRYAEIAREMVVNHDYLTPRNNFVRYFEKPPLVYWATAASLKVLGQSEFAVRLQAAVASVGQVVITQALGEQMFGATTGLIAATALALSPLFFAFAGFATPDPALALFLTAAMACFYLGSQFAASRGAIDSRWMLATATLLALGTLTKGPVAVVLGGTIGILWLTIEGRSHQVLQLPWFKCAALYLGITAPWFVLVALRNPGFLHFFIIHEHFQRYLVSTEHGWGPWFYVPITIAGTWPWCFFVPFAWSRSDRPFRILRPARNGALAREADRYGAGKTRERAALHFLVIWFAVVLVFFSIPHSKLGEYILPGLPPIAILAARGLMQLSEYAESERQRLLLVFAAINAAAAITIMAAIVIAPLGGLSHALAENTIIVAAAMLAGGVAPLLTHSSRTAGIAMPLAIAGVIAMAAGMDARERIAPLVSYRGLAASIAPYADQGCRLMSYRHFEQALPFYTGAEEHLVDYRGELEPFGPPQDSRDGVFSTLSQLKENWAGDQCAVLVANRSDLPALTSLLSPAAALIGCEGKKVALFNRSVDSSARAIRQCVDPVKRDELEKGSYWFEPDASIN
jgi:4-amino-4-deoxy-L-arabinose transferase-like glycosyltransferase